MTMTLLTDIYVACFKIFPLVSIHERTSQFFQEACCLCALAIHRNMFVLSYFKLFALGSNAKG